VFLYISLGLFTSYLLSCLHVDVLFVCCRLEKEYSTLKTKEQEEQVELRVSVVTLLGR